MVNKTMTIIEYAQIAAPVIFTIVGIAGFGWFKIIKGTNDLLKEQNAELKTANKELQDQHLESVRKLAAMQGQIDVLKSIPLVNIDTTLQKIADFNEKLSISNEKILKTLKATAEIAAEDRDVLTGQDK